VTTQLQLIIIIIIIIIIIKSFCNKKNVLRTQSMV